MDTVAPTAAPIISQNSGYSQVTTGAEWKLGLGNSGYEYFFLNSVADSSGVASGKYIVYRQDGTIYKSVDVPFTSATNSFTYAIENSFPNSNLQEVFKIGFDVTDLAGNVFISPRQGCATTTCWVHRPSRSVSTIRPLATCSAPGLMASCLTCLG